MFYQLTFSVKFSLLKSCHHSEYYEEYKQLEEEHVRIENQKKNLVLDGVQEGEKGRIAELNERDRELKKKGREIIDRIASSSNQKIPSNDKDYVFIHFILHNLPRGIVGLLLAVILAQPCPLLPQN